MFEKGWKFFTFLLKKFIFNFELILKRLLLEIISVIFCVTFKVDHWCMFWGFENYTEKKKRLLNQVKDWKGINLSSYLTKKGGEKKEEEVSVCFWINQKGLLLEIKKKKKVKLMSLCHWYKIADNLVWPNDFTSASKHIVTHFYAYRSKQPEGNHVGMQTEHTGWPGQMSVTDECNNPCSR